MYRKHYEHTRGIYTLSRHIRNGRSQSDSDRTQITGKIKEKRVKYHVPGTARLWNMTP